MREVEFCSACRTTSCSFPVGACCNRDVRLPATPSAVSCLLSVESDSATTARSRSPIRRLLLARRARRTARRLAHRIGSPSLSAASATSLAFALSCARSARRLSRWSSALAARSVPHAARPLLHSLSASLASRSRASGPTPSACWASPRTAVFTAREDLFASVACLYCASAAAPRSLAASRSLAAWAALWPSSSSMASASLPSAPPPPG